MREQSWTFTSIEDGQAVETVRGLSRQEAVEAIHAVMHGYDCTPKPREIAARKSAESERVAPLAA